MATRVKNGSPRDPREAMVRASMFDLSAGVSWFFSGIAIAGFARTLVALWHLRWMHRLPAWDSLEQGDSGQSSAMSIAAPRVSVVVAARDEAARIEESVRRLLGQRYVQLEVIVVDDRSTDGTTEILQRVGKDDARLHVRRVDALPPGWLGKCHACHVGASAATGEWILFTDADCWLKPDVIARAVCVADREGVGHVVLTPGLDRNDPGTAAWQVGFLANATRWMTGVNRDRPGAYVGVGAFNLVRAGAYRACGGYEALRLTVVDDMKLGLLLRRAGERTRAFIGGDDAECHWGGNAREFIRLTEKNFFAVFDYRLSVVLALVFAGNVYWFGAMVGPFTGTLAGAAAGLGLLSLALPAAILACRSGRSLWPVWRVPFLLPVMLWGLLNSTLATLRRGGVRWRETFYRLEVLRAGNVR